MKTYTTQEAAAATGLSVRALRKRIERGQLRAVQHGRYWRLPHAELERAGLVPSEGTLRSPRGQREQATASHPFWPSSKRREPKTCA